MPASGCRLEGKEYTVQDGDVMLTVQLLTVF